MDSNDFIPFKPKSFNRKSPLKPYFEYTLPPNFKLFRIVLYVFLEWH